MQHRSTSGAAPGHAIPFWRRRTTPILDDQRAGVSCCSPSSFWTARLTSPPCHASASYLGHADLTVHPLPLLLLLVPSNLHTADGKLARAILHSQPRSNPSLEATAGRGIVCSGACLLTARPLLSRAPPAKLTGPRPPAGGQAGNPCLRHYMRLCLALLSLLFYVARNSLVAAHALSAGPS
jgi:hypothetical protein